MLNPLNFISKLIKSSNQKELDKIQKVVGIINDFEGQISSLKDEDFPRKTQELKKKTKTKPRF